MDQVKPGYLDQFLLEDIARHCPQQFLSFHQCMSQEKPDPKLCAQEQANLSKCIKSSVPSFQRIQNQCAGKMQAYDACLRMNKSNTQKCSDDLKGLRDCAFDTIDS